MQVEEIETITRDENGHYKHPFESAPPELQTIYNSKRGSFSTKLHRVEGTSKKARKLIGMGDFQLNQLSYWDRLQSYFIEDY